MQYRIFLLILITYCTNIHPGFFSLDIESLKTYVTGDTDSQNENVEKLKMANYDTLKERASQTSLNEEFLEKTNFLEIFADQEISVDEIDKKFEELKKNIWNSIYQQVNLATYAFISVVGADEVNSELAKVKPTLLKVLLEQEHPEVYEKLTAPMTDAQRKACQPLLALDM